MTEITTKSIFGKKPLIEEQLDLFFVSEHIDFASAFLDPNISGSYYLEPTILENISKEKRQKKAKEHYNKALVMLKDMMD